MKYYFWVIGCAMNYSDAERISAVFDSLGFKKTKNEKEADIVCVIACSVRQHAIDRIFGKVKEWNETKKQRQLLTILSGCVLEKDKTKMKQIFDIVFDINDLHQLPELLTELSSIESSRGFESGDYLSITPHYTSFFRAYVPISTGCNNFCTYCAVPFTRGREKSRPMDEILSEVNNLISHGCKEITLLGQNVNSYGNDLVKKPDEKYFTQLIKKIDKISGDYRVYFYSNHPKDISDELLRIWPNLKHFPLYLHLPLQSGNNEILKLMNRHYTKVQYLNLVKKIRKSLPDILLTTDVIVGFPGETNDHFLDTLEVVKEAEFEMAFIAQFSSRPGTKAAKMTGTVLQEEKKERDIALNTELTKIVFHKNQKLVGTVLEVLIDEEKKDKIYGRTASYKVVEIIKSPTINIGDFIKVKIESATAWKLFGVKI